MKQVQYALRNLDVPVFSGVWRATSDCQNPPMQYVVYSTTTTEAWHEDDAVTCLRTYVYMNLWSDYDPTDTRDAIRKAMYNAGFGMIEESDRGYNMPAYDSATRQYTVQWTWCISEEALPYGHGNEGLQ